MPSAASSLIQVLVDDREQRSPLWPLLRDSSLFDAQLQRLPLGDYAVGDSLLFERKTLPDLTASIISGRLFDQALRLSKSKRRRPAMILEGTGRDLRACRLSWSAIQGAMATVTLFIGLPVLRTRTPQESLDTLRFAAAQAQAIATGALTRKAIRPGGKTQLQCFILQGCPGIGPKRAARLLSHFGSVEAVIRAPEQALASVEGIGLETARRIRWSVEESSPAYHVGLNAPTGTGGCGIGAK